MRAGLGIALAVATLGSSQALSGPAAAPPDLDCSLGFDALHNWSAWLPGAQRENRDGRDVITFANPDIWRVEIRFTKPGEPAHPAVSLRKFVKQVTGVWTAQSKACGYGDQIQFAALLAELKAEDTRLTNASPRRRRATEKRAVAAVADAVKGFTPTPAHPRKGEGTERRSSHFSPPLDGEGPGWGEERGGFSEARRACSRFAKKADVLGHLAWITPPPPNPSPQGRGESSGWRNASPRPSMEEEFILAGTAGLMDSASKSHYLTQCNC